MSASEFKVMVVADDRLAELTIVDSHYHTRARGVGRIECNLPRGLYVARARSGESTLQKKVRVTSENVFVEFSVVGNIHSSAPLDSDSFEQARMHSIGVAPAVTQNASSWMLLALRHTVGSQSTSDFQPVQNAGGFELCSVNGNPIQTFGSLTLSPTPSGHWVSALQLESGWYTLAIPGDSGSRILLPLYVGARFSPSVFVELREQQEGSPRPDLDRLLVSYDDRESGIFRNTDRMRAIELARRSLVLGRNILTPALMEILYHQKYQDPILGLFAAHLLLSDRTGDKGATAFAEVVENTGKILGYPQHPDLVIARALGRQCGWWKAPSMPGDAGPLVAPPLLRSSWDGMLQLKDRRQELVAMESPLRQIAGSLIRSNAWVLWRQTSAATTTSRSIALAGATSTPRRSRSSGSADALLARLFDRLRTDPDLASIIRRELTSGAYEGNALSRTIAQAVLQLTQLESDRSVPRGYAKRLAESLSVPVPLIAEGISSIVEAIRQRTKTLV